MSEREDHSQSQSTTEASASEGTSDLITPRPGPSDASQRTTANLSTPLPAFQSWSSDREKKCQYPTTSEDDGEEPAFPSKLPPGYRPPPKKPSTISKESVTGEGSILATAQATQVYNRDSEHATVKEGQPSQPYSSSNRGSQSGSSEGSTKRPRSKRNASSIHTQRRRSPKNDSSPKLSPRASPKQSPADGPSVSSTSLAVPERTKSISFSPAPSQRASPDTSLYSAYTMSRRRDSPAISPHARNDLKDNNHDVESSADENTAIFRKTHSSKTGVGTKSSLGYGTNAATAVTSSPFLGETIPQVVPIEDDIRFPGYEGAAEEEPPGSRDLSPVERRRKSAAATKSNQNGGRGRTASRRGSQESFTEDEGWSSWWRTVFDRYGSIELENKGSVARDHLALERTFLAWLRTSLSFASIGIAVTQLFRLNTSISNNDSASSHAFTPATNLRDPFWIQPQAVSNYDYKRLRQVGKPLGATFLGISILILLLGFHRYFESQHYVIRGKFPASRGSIVIVAALSGGLIVASLAVVLAIAPSAFEKR